MPRPVAASLLAAALLIPAACGKQAEAPVPQPPQVQVSEIAPADVPLVKTFVGRIAAKRSVEIKANVTGYLLERAFTEGGLVKQGDVLFRIDPREFEANLETARAKQAQAEARLAQAELDVRRIEPLAKAGAAPQQELDNARTSLLSATADLRAAKAAVSSAEVNLSYTTIAAPFPGRIGKAAVDPGTLVSPQTGVLATLDQIDPIAVEFTLSEDEVMRTRKLIDAGLVTSPGRDHFEVQVSTQDGARSKEPGRIDYADIRIRPETGTALVRAIMPNPDGRLVPGVFVRAHLIGLVRKAALLVPQSAVIQSPTGASLFTVAADGSAASAPVVLGEWMGERWLVESGLKAGDKVVVDGIQKVRAGAKVSIVQAKEKAAEAAPAKPDDQGKPAAH